MKVLPRISLVVMILLLLVRGLATTASAETQEGDRVVVAADDVVTDDLYVAADDLVIDGVVEGDVLGFARTVTVNGTVTGDLMVGAQSVIINGVVEDDARVGCQAFTLNSGGRIDDDLAIGSFSFDFQPESKLGGDLWFGAYQGVLAGRVDGDVTGGGNGLDIQGTVGGNAKLDLGEDTGSNGFTSQQFSQFMPDLPVGVTLPTVRGGLTVGPNAAIEGQLDYSAVAEGRISPDASTGTVTFRPQVKEDEVDRKTPGEVFVAGLIRQGQRLVRLLVVGFLMVWLIPAWLNRASQALSDRPWPSLGWGALSPVAMGVVLGVTLAAILILSLVLNFVIGGATIATVLLTSLAGTVTMVYLLLAFYLAALITGFTLGQMLLTGIKPDDTANPFAAMAIGVAIVWVVTLIPVLGILVGIVLALFGLGAAWLAIRTHFGARPAMTVAAD